MTDDRDFVTQGASAMVLRLSIIPCGTVPQATLGNTTLWPAELGRASAFDDDDDDDKYLGTYSTGAGSS